MKDSLNRIQPVIDGVRRYSITIAILVIGGVYGYLIYTSSALVQVEPSETQVSEKYQAAKRPKLDESIVKKLNELQDSNIAFKALIDDARANPFLE